MTVAYIDTSCVVAIAFGEPGSRALARRIEAYDHVVSSNLLEAELRSAMTREGVDEIDGLLDGVGWLLPDRPLTAEFQRVLTARYLRGADLWHLATALYLAESPADMDFLTLDAAQREAATALGFSTPIKAVS
jgi:predicted nucleic acid-binding protein